MAIPIIDISKFLKDGQLDAAHEIGKACSEFGFFCISNHAVDLDLQNELERLSHAFFAQSLDEKMKISMEYGGRAWRGYFPVGGELTSGFADLKEGLYLGDELGENDSRVIEKWPLHGSNLFTQAPVGLRSVVHEYMSAMRALSDKLMEAISVSLHLEDSYFNDHFTREPTPLFRIFHYPFVKADADTAQSEKDFPWGVGEHTDYGLLTILKQDDKGGLEVKARNGNWLAVPPKPNVFVCNVGDMLDYLTHGRYVSVPHRVKNVSGQSRFSYPYFFDPGFKAKIEPLPLPAVKDESLRPSRWDGENLYLFRGNYGDYLQRKISKVFPDLAKAKL